ncbi:MAG: hypothetical protein IKP22_00475 [Clostridia bacterium]|nr:hypothetical protein [Clostridia bacterium]
MTGKAAFRMRVAGRTAEIRPMYGEIRELCRDYLAPSEGAADIMAEITPEDIQREEVEAARQGQGIIPPARLETSAVLRKIAAAMPQYDTFLMHGVVISTAGQGYMITAPSGTGKSTRARLWADHIPGSLIVNGDKPFLRVGEDGVTAFGTPWCGKEGWNVNMSVPLRAVFILERSETGDSVERLSFGEAFPALFRQAYRPDGADERLKTLALLQALGGKVNIYRFRSGPTLEAVRLAYQAGGEGL